MKAILRMAVLLTLLMLIVSGAVSVSTLTEAYDPWADSDDDGDIDIFDIVYYAGMYGSAGEPFDAKAAIEFDSSWLNITDRCGEYITLNHDVSSTEIMVDISGKASVDGGIHQRNLGGTGLILGWIQPYGGADMEFGKSGVQTADGGYVIAGFTASYGAGDKDAWLVKTDMFGNPVWNQTYGGAFEEAVRCVLQTTDGGYVLAGYTESFGAGDFDVWLVKTDAAGNREWNHTFGGTGSDFGYSVVQTTDGGYAIAGDTSSFGAGNRDFWLIKTDVLGNHVWNQTYGRPVDDSAQCVIPTSDGGYALTGYTDPFGPTLHNMWLVKTDKQGNHLWNRTFGGLQEEVGYSIIQATDTGYVVAGITHSFGAGNADFWLLKTDRFGNYLWDQTYGGTNYDYGRSVVQTGDGGYAIVGDTDSFGAGDLDLWLVKTDAAGNHQWNQTYGGTMYDWGMSVIQTTDGGYTVAGYTQNFGAGNTDMWLVRISMDSGLTWTDTTTNTITLYRGATDSYWNFVRVRIWKIKENP